MDPTYQRFLAIGTAERLVDALSEEQFLRPHQSVADALTTLVDKLGICPAAANQAVESLQIDTPRSIGRLRRTELTQLARTIYRVWRQSVAEAPDQSQHA